MFQKTTLLTTAAGTMLLNIILVGPAWAEAPLDPAATATEAPPQASEPDASAQQPSAHGMPCARCKAMGHHPARRHASHSAETHDGMHCGKRGSYGKSVPPGGGPGMARAWAGSPGKDAYTPYPHAGPEPFHGAAHPAHPSRLNPWSGPSAPPQGFPRMVEQPWGGSGMGYPFDGRGSLHPYGSAMRRYPPAVHEAGYGRMGRAPAYPHGVWGTGYARGYPIAAYPGYGVGGYDRGEAQGMSGMYGLPGQGPGWVWRPWRLKGSGMAHGNYQEQGNEGLQGMQGMEGTQGMQGIPTPGGMGAAQGMQGMSGQDNAEAVEIKSGSIEGEGYMQITPSGEIYIYPRVEILAPSAAATDQDQDQDQDQP